MKGKICSRLLQTLTPKEKPYEVRDSDLKGFMIRVQPSGHMSYICDFSRPDGRRDRITIGSVKVLSPAQARDQAMSILGELAKGNDPVAKHKASQVASLEAFLDKRYQSHVESHHKRGTETAELLRGRFAEFLNHPLTEITAWKVESWRTQRLKAGIKAATINRNVTVLKSALNKAVAWEMIAANPIARVKPLKEDSAPKVRFLTDDEEGNLRSALVQRENRIRRQRQSHNDWLRARHQPLLPSFSNQTFADHLAPMVIISINTGMRQGELFKLRWEDVNFQARYITITGDTAKSGSTRHIPMNDEVFQVLSDWRNQSAPEELLVFKGRTGREFNNSKKSWAKLLTDASIKAFRWHDMRHHFASRLVMEGVDLNTVRELLGHSTLKMTLRYAHLAPKVKADAVAKLVRKEPRPALAVV